MEIYRVSSKNGTANCRNEYINNIKKAQQNIDIVCGEFDPNFYNSEEFVESVHNFLNLKGKNISIIFNGESNSKKEAAEKIRVLNNRFLDMIANINPTSQKKIEFYWCPIRPKRHYTIIDNQTTIIEEDHEFRGPRDIYTFKENNSTAREWGKKFLEMKKYCDPIDIKDLTESYKKEKTKDTLYKILTDLEELKRIED